jgi:hypothetical protein
MGGLIVHAVTVPRTVVEAEVAVAEGIVVVAAAVAEEAEAVAEAVIAAEIAKTIQS